MRGERTEGTGEATSTEEDKCGDGEGGTGGQGDEGETEEARQKEGGQGERVAVIKEEELVETVSKRVEEIKSMPSFDGEDPASHG